jgi:peptidyl-prolyl cis-trans isomerase A (cyclophilin A)
MFLPRPFVCAVVALAFLVPRFLSAQIFADVTVAGGVNGTFTIDLEYTKAPTTVASFIGLATGARPWIDQATGAIRSTPFYTGVTFHRVIAGFMSQTGSRNGLGTDGPGYAFRDEFEPTLRHDGAYVVSMANSGKHTNGSQIFITASAQGQLNDKHSVFGRVIAGQAICDAINTTPTGAGDVPVTPVTIQSIAVHGAGLAGFNLSPATLPTVRDAAPILSRSGATYLLAYDARTYSAYTGYRGSDLTAWSLFKSSYSPGVAPSGVDNVTALATGARHFFRLARIDYAGSANLFVPASIAGRTYTFTSNFPYPIVLAIDAAGTGGTWTMPGLANGSGALLLVSHTPGAYTAAIRAVFNSLAVFGGNVDFRPTLDYTNANGGTFTGTTNFGSYPNLSGTFTTTP